jgi:hypothetical protein
MIKVKHKRAALNAKANGSEPTVNTRWGMYVIDFPTLERNER